MHQSYGMRIVMVIGNGSCSIGVASNESIKRSEHTMTATKYEILWRKEKEKLCPVMAMMVCHCVTSEKCANCAKSTASLDSI